MLKKVSLIISAALISLVFTVASVRAANPPAAEANPITISYSSALSTFPTQLTFNIKATSNVNITDIRLHYAIEHESFAKVTSESYVSFTPGASVNAQWIWDMRQTGGLPTGSIVKYWWTIKDTSGNQLVTAPANVSFDDNRYAWKSLVENNVTLYWYQGNQSFATDLMSTAQQAITRLAQNTGAGLQKPIKIYIYANTQDLQGAMIFPQDWTGGVAFTDFGIIAIGIDTGNLAWGKGALAHELTHLVVHQMTFNPYIGLPTWLDEGLAMYNEGALDSSFVDSLKQAINNSSLISVRSLASPFSANSNQAILSYAQSYSIIEYLVTNYGQSKMLQLLNTFSRGSNYDDALNKVYGFDMDGLNTLWRVYVIQHYKATGKSTELPPAFNIWANERVGSFVPERQLVAISGAGR